MTATVLRREHDYVEHQRSPTRSSIGTWQGSGSSTPDWQAPFIACSGQAPRGVIRSDKPRVPIACAEARFSRRSPENSGGYVVLPRAAE
ncbi:hypothetical protein MRX96_046246 [Rhipicephalus microplus]